MISNQPQQFSVCMYWMQWERETNVQEKKTIACKLRHLKSKIQIKFGKIVWPKVWHYHVGARTWKKKKDNIPWEGIISTLEMLARDKIIFTLLQVSINLITFWPSAPTLEGMTKATQCVIHLKWAKGQGEFVWFSKLVIAECH